MMKKLVCAMIMGTMFGWMGSAHAKPLHFYEMQGGYSFDDVNLSQTWTFNLDDDVLFSAWDGSGSDPYGQIVDISAKDIINNAWIEISFYDNEEDVGPRTKERADLIIDGALIFSGKEIDTSYFHRNLATSLDDHLLTVTVTNAPVNSKGLYGDFDVMSVLVGGRYTDNTAPVPEPGTLLLFASGLAGLAAFGRRTSNRK